MGRLRYKTECEFELPADALWGAVRDFGNVEWLDDDCTCELDGQGVGMLRRIRMRGGEPACEKLLAVDPDEQAIEYTITSGNPMPIDDYKAKMRVVALPGDRARLEWSSSFDALDGVPDEKAVRAVERLYRSVLPTMKRKLEQAHR